MPTQSNPSSRKLFAILFGLPLVLIVPFLLIGSSVYHAGMIEVEVMEKGDNGTSVSVSIPGAIVPVALHFIPECTIDDVRCEIDGEARMAIDIAREALRSISHSPDGVYVDVRTTDEIIRVEKEGTMFRVFVDTPDELVRLAVPVSVASSVLAAI